MKRLSPTSTKVNPLLALLGAAALVLTGCSSQAEPSPSNSSTPSNSSASPTTSSPSPSNTASAFDLLRKSIYQSVEAMNQRGVTDTYWEGDKLFYVEVYDPASPLDYKGAGWIAATEKVEFVFELDMYQVGQLQRAIDAAKPGDVTLESDGRYRLDISLEYFPDYALIRLGEDDLVSEVWYPSEAKPDRVRVVYAIDDFGLDILKRANRELLD